MSESAARAAEKLVPMLGDAYDPSAPETAQELCVAQRNILLAALRYDTAQRQAANNSLILARQVKLLALDEAIVTQLAGSPALAAYLAADAIAQSNLLFSNSYLLEEEEPGKPAHPGLGRELANQAAAVAGHDPARALFTQKLAVLTDLNALDAPDVGTDPAGGSPAIAHDLRPWLRYHAWRKVHYLSQLEQHWLLEEFVADETRLLAQLRKGSDLALVQPAQFARKTAPKARPPAPAAGPAAALPLLAGPAAATDDFDTAKAELAKVTSELKQAAANLNTTGLKDTDKLLKFEAEYAALSQKQAAYAYLLAQKRESLSKTSWAVEKTKDWLAANRANTSAVLMATGQALWAGAGLSMAQALKNHYTGKPVDPELGKKVAIGVAIAAGTALATYLLGPVGPMVSGMALSYCYPQPDPVMDALKSIEGKVDLGFKRTEQQLIELAAQVTQGFSDVDRKLKKIAEETLDKSGLKAELLLFREEIEKADALLSELEQPYTLLFEVEKPELVAFTGKLMKQRAEFGGKLDALVRRFYRRDYILSTGKLDGSGDPGKPPLALTLSQLIIRFYQRPDLAYFQPFHVVCGDLSALANRLGLLVTRYFAVRPKVQAVLAAAAVFMVEDNKALVLRHLLDMQRREAHEHGAYFAGVLQLDRLVLGARNHTLYLTLNPYLLTNDPRPGFNVLTGFGLVPAAAPTDQHYEPVQGTGDAPATWLRATPRPVAVARSGRDAPRPSAPARYYLAPAGRAEADLTYQTYQLFSFWHHHTQPARLCLHLALAEHDQVLLYPVGFGGTAVLAQAVGCDSPAFADSFEQWVLADSPVTQTDLFFKSPASLPKSLPQAGIELNMRPEEHRRGPSSQQVTLYTANWISTLLPRGGHALNAQDSFWPLLRPEVVGVCQRKQELAHDQGWYSSVGAGLWATEQALGKYRPVVVAADEPKQHYQRPYSEEWSERLPFRHVLYPGDWLQSLRSPNGRYWLQLECWPGPEPVLYCYENGQRQGSVFGKYDYREQLGRLRIEMQTDGNLVLYDYDDKGSRHPVAATDTSDLPGTLLSLNNDGQLQLCGTDAEVKRTLALHTLKMKRGERLNYWPASSGRILQNSMLHSPGGAYEVKLEYTADADLQVWLGNMVGTGRSRPMKVEQTVEQPGLALVRRRVEGGQRHDAGNWRRTVQVVPPVSHGSGNRYDSYYWDKCSEEATKDIDKLGLNSQEKRVFLDFRNGGEVVGGIVSRQSPLLVKTFYGSKQITQLVAPDPDPNAGTYLLLADDGSLTLCRRGTDQLLVTLLEAERRS